MVIEMQYKAKEVSQILNIPIDTLRYFEKIGVIHPKLMRKIIIVTMKHGTSILSLIISIIVKWITLHKKVFNLFVMLL